MAAFPQPTQALPSWLSLSSTVITGVDGSVSTSFTTLQLPLTYYGPPVNLGTDGVWTYGGLTPPPSISVQPTSSESITSATPSTSLTSIPLTSEPSSGIIPSSASTSSSSASTSTSPVPAPIAATSHGISTGVLGAVLGSILGFFLLLVILLTLCLLRRNTRRRRLSDPESDEPTSSSFWNRSTFLSFPWVRPDSVRHTPIWTGWQLVEPDEATDPNARRSGSGNGSRGSGGSRRRGGQEGARTPGDGSPRGSGDEIDPFLVRHSVHSGTLANEMSQTKTETDTLVSVPPAAATGTISRSSPPRTGHIIPRDVLLQRMQEEDDASAPYPDIRLVQPSTKEEYSPLMPPPPLDPDNMKSFGVRTDKSRPVSDKSAASQKPGPSVHSEKSLGSLDEQEHAELLTARRVRVGDQPMRLPTIESSDSESSAAPRPALGLSGLGSRLGRLSWFKRLSSSGGASPSTSGQPVVDNYTQSPSRSRGHSRGGSQPRLLNDADPDAVLGSPTSPTFPASPQPPSSPRNGSGTEMGLLIPPPPPVRPLSFARRSATTNRPISSLSTRTTASGHTAYFDAPSRPPSSLVQFPVPVLSNVEQEHLARMPPDERMTLSGADIGVPFNPPPAYEASPLPDQPSEIDILDVPAPAPASALSARQPQFPPGLSTVSAPQTWRESFASSPQISDVDSDGIDINIEDDPPEAQEEWRDLASEREGRRRTFGMPNIVHQHSGLVSQHPSVYTSSSRLRPRGSRSPAPRSQAHSQEASSNSGHTLTGSASSRPSQRSPLRSVSSAQSLFVYSDEQHEGSENLYPISPPLSAVMGSMSSAGDPTRPLSMQMQPPMPPVPEMNTPGSSPHLQHPSGTVTSNTSSGTGGTTNASVTTTGTDPVTGVVLHFPPVPVPRGQSEKHDSWGVRRRDDYQ